MKNERISEKDHFASLITEGMISSAKVMVASNAPILLEDDGSASYDDQTSDFDDSGRDLTQDVEPKTSKGLTVNTEYIKTQANNLDPTKSSFGARLRQIKLVIDETLGMIKGDSKYGFE